MRVRRGMLRSLDSRLARLGLAALPLLHGCSGSTDATPEEPAAGPPARYAEHAGRYATDRLAALEVEAHGELISIVPPFWTSKPYFRSDDGRTFLMELPSPRPDRTAVFDAFSDGTPATVILSGVDDRHDGRPFRRLGPDERTAIERFLAGDAESAAKIAIEEAADDDALAEFALRAFLTYRSRGADAARLLERLVEARPRHARLRSLLGHARVSAGRREEALRAFEEALALDPEDTTAVEGSRRLRLEEPPPGTGYRAVLPFALPEAMAPPTAEEIAAVRRDWAGRDLAARGVERVAGGALALAHAELEVHVLRHEVHGDAHHGAVFVPRGAAPGSLPAVLDVRGVNPTYSPMDVSSSTRTHRALGPAQGEFVFLVPGLRGNTLIFRETEHVSGGDPSDAWDGATDDTLAFLNAALATTPEIDPGRIAVVGYSRGGTVALLAGIRDDRIDLVLDVVGPVDHLAAMDPLGWTTAEILADVLRDGTIPGVTEEGGQDFDHWFDRVAEGETLAGVRTRLIASSPLWFAEDLPETHAWYGSEDRSVPLANARLLRARLADLGRLDRDATVRVFEGRGHDTDPLEVQRATTRRLTAWAGR